MLAFASTWLGLTWFVVPPATIATIWPTSGLLLAFLLLTTPDEWPLLLLSAGLATGLAQLLARTPPLISLALTLTHLAATLLAATLVRRWAAAPLTMHRLRDILGLVMLAALASNALTALLGAVVVWASFGTPFWLAWEIWFVADGSSLLLLTPLVLSWLGPAPLTLPTPRRRLAEVIGLILCLLLISGGIFVANTRTGAMAPYPLFPFLIWAVLRFQMRGTTVVTLFFASLILLGAVRGQGVFVASTTNLLAAILSAQQYLAVIVTSSYVMAALVAERATDHEAKRVSEATLHSFFDSAAVMMGIVEVLDHDLLHVSDNAATLRFLGLPADQPFPYRASAIGVPQAHLQLWCAHYATCLQSGAPVAFEYPHTTVNGPRWLAATVSLIAAGPTTGPRRFAYLVEDVTERKQAEAALRVAHDKYAYQARHDPLTGLFNRLALNDHILAELARANRGSLPLSLAILDIDHFKVVNDLHGHLVGDQALAHLAHILTQTVRPYDWVGRWGGEEFLVVLAGTSLEEAAIIAERLRTQIVDSPLPLAAGQPLRLTVSIGVACTDLHPAGEGDAEWLFRHADEALYAAKHAGRNQVSCAAPDVVSVDH